ncbi:MAG: endonuclease III [Eubacterium sp.]|nr:endonuclease III [Eubacterium sp.]
MTKKELAVEVCKRLDSEYGRNIECFLHYDPNKPWQLLIATILSAQCTDARVNEVTKSLFKKYDTLQKFAEAEVSELEKDIYSTGFYKNKARNIKACSIILLEEYNGAVPWDIDLLVKLPGVGRKTANVIRGNIYNIDSIVVDTHVKRVSRLLGLTGSEEPEKIEVDLMKCIPKDNWIIYNMQVILLGRNICISGRPKCDICPMRDICKGKVNKS